MADKSWDVSTRAKELPLSYFRYLTELNLTSDYGTLTYMRERNDLFNFDTLDQILEMDDEGSHEFTTAIFESFCDQAEQSIARL
jgi:hypothetical protein